MKYGVKRRWWVWGIGIMFNVLAIRALQLRIYPLFFLVFLIDILVILPEASHYCYNLDRGILTIKRVLFSDIVIPCSDITLLEKAIFLTLGGFGVRIFEHSFQAYKITYRVNNRRKVVIISPKDSEFMKEFTSYIDNTVIMFDKAGTTFKYKKDKTDEDKAKNDKK